MWWINEKNIALLLKTIYSWVFCSLACDFSLFSFSFFFVGFVFRFTHFSLHPRLLCPLWANFNGNFDFHGTQPTKSCLVYTPNCIQLFGYGLFTYAFCSLTWLALGFIALICVLWKKHACGQNLNWYLFRCFVGIEFICEILDISHNKY